MGVSVVTSAWLTSCAVAQRILTDVAQTPATSVDTVAGMISS